MLDKWIGELNKRKRKYVINVPNIISSLLSANKNWSSNFFYIFLSLIVEILAQETLI